MADPPVETTVQQVLEGPNNWKDKDIYLVLFADRPDKHSFFVPQGDPPPTDEGAEKGWFGQKQNGDPKFTRASENGAQRSQGGPSGDEPGKYDRKPDHPTVETRAKHSTSIGAAPAYIDQLLTVGGAEQPKTWDAYWTLAEQVIAKLEATYPTAES